MTAKKSLSKLLTTAAIFAAFLGPVGVIAQDGAVVLKAVPVSEKFDPKAVYAAVWKNVPSHDIVLDTAPPVHDAVSGEAAIKRIKVQVARNEDGVLFRLQWKDKTADTRLRNLNTFIDGVAIQFAIDRDPATSPIMGGEGKMVNIWYWNARMNKGQNLIANGFGTLAPLTTQDVTATGKYRTGTWTVVFHRRTKPAEAQAVNLDGTGKWPVSFAVWDGANQERDGLKAVNVEWQVVSF